MYNRRSDSIEAAAFVAILCTYQYNTPGDPPGAHEGAMEGYLLTDPTPRVGLLV